MSDPKTVDEILDEMDNISDYMAKILLCEYASCIAELVVAKNKELPIFSNSFDIDTPEIVEVKLIGKPIPPSLQETTTIKTPLCDKVKIGMRLYDKTNDTEFTDNVIIHFYQMEKDMDPDEDIALRMYTQRMKVFREQSESIATTVKWKEKVDPKTNKRYFIFSNVDSGIPIAKDGLSGHVEEDDPYGLVGFSKKLSIHSYKLPVNVNKEKVNRAEREMQLQRSVEAMRYNASIERGQQLEPVLSHKSGIESVRRFLSGLDYRKV